MYLRGNRKMIFAVQIPYFIKWHPKGFPYSKIRVTLIVKEKPPFKIFSESRVFK